MDVESSATRLVPSRTMVETSSIKILVRSEEPKGLTATHRKEMKVWVVDRVRQGGQ